MNFSKIHSYRFVKSTGRRKCQTGSKGCLRTNRPSATDLKVNCIVVREHDLYITSMVRSVLTLA